MSPTTPQKQLPSDPDGKNNGRAHWAGAALAAFMGATRAHYEDALSDLLTGLMHWADRYDFDMDAALERARGQYEAETGGDEQGRPV